MTEEQKKQNIDLLRASFMTFMDVLIHMPGSQMQKQQAFIKFDEGHMWMQNAVMSHVDPVVSESVEAIETIEPIDAQPLESDYVEPVSEHLVNPLPVENI